MNKYFILLILAVSLFTWFGFISYAQARKSQTKLINPTATATPKPLAEIEKIELDRNEVVYICPYSNACGKDENLSIMVKTIVSNPQKRPLTYAYTISGGRIIGQGAQVVWDLKGVRPGTYTITAAIDEGRGFSYETKSETITVKECPICDLPCICPTISVIGSESAKSGEIATFKAKVLGGNITKVSYNWTISRGEIAEGQGTSEIKVKITDDLIGYAVRAIVEVAAENSSEELCADCPREASEITLITK